MVKTKHYYFAYGSNMNPSRVKHRCMAFSHYEAGILSGYCLVFNKRSVKYPGTASANIMQQANNQVEGVVYHLADERQITVMDPFEGYPERYNRILVPIETHNGLLDVWVYIANPAHIQEGLKPAAWYLGHLLAGRQFLSPAYVEMLGNIICLPDSESEPGAGPGR